VNGNFYNGSQLVLYVGNIDSVQVNLNGQNLQLGTSCFNTLYAVNPNYVPQVRVALLPIILVMILYMQANLEVLHQHIMFGL
jgi:hypothetical protein